MNAYEATACGLRELAAEAGPAQPQIRWNGKLYNIFPNLSENNQPLRSGGFSQAYDFNFTAEAAQFFKDIPAPDIKTLVNSLVNTSFEYLGMNYKFVTVSPLAGGTVLNCGANSSQQNA